HRLVEIDNAAFCQAHADLAARAQSVFHTYAAAFYRQNDAVEVADGVPIVNGSGPDESMIGTEKIPIAELLTLRELPRREWLDHLLGKIDYIKIPESTVAGMVRGNGASFVASRRQQAAKLVEAPDFLEFQRRYHAFTMLQDHIRELSAVAQVLDRQIVFPYLTNDIFRITFAARFGDLNVGGIY